MKVFKVKNAIFVLLIYVDFDEIDEIYTTTIAVGEDSVKYPYTCGIDADNIMDYDKE